MDELKECCTEILKLIDIEFPNQKNFSGAVKKINLLVNEIYEAASKGILKGGNIRWESIIRQFVDETTHYKSPIIIEIEKMSNLIAKLQETSV